MLLKIKTNFRLKLKNLRESTWRISIPYHFLGSENLVEAERPHLIPKNRPGNYKVKRLEPETGDGRPARFLDAEESIEADLLKQAKEQEKNRKNRKPKHDF